MKSRSAISALYIVGGLYDGILGVGFLFFWGNLFRYFEVTPPNHPGYVQFPALLLIVFALMFFAIAADPIRNRNLIPYGVLLKAAYSGTVFWHWSTQGIPNMWKPFAWIDLAFMVLFIWSYLQLRHQRPGSLD
jgi:hypothetical protein